jgi:hypothetical protein
MAALLAGLAVAGYAVVDSYGTRLTGDWLGYTAWLNITDGLLFAGMVYAMRGWRLWPELYRAPGRIFASGFTGGRQKMPLNGSTRLRFSRSCETPRSGTARPTS